jgi:membrane protease YdiL (CAAX protease family)
LSGYLKHVSIDKSNILGNIASSFYVAISEELFGRGLIFYSIFRQSKNFILAAIVSSLTFTFFHLLGMPIIENYPLFIFYFTIAIIMCYMMILSNSLIPCFLFSFHKQFIKQISRF